MDNKHIEKLIARQTEAWDRHFKHEKNYNNCFNEQNYIEKLKEAMGPDCKGRIELQPIMELLKDAYDQGSNFTDNSWLEYYERFTDKIKDKADNLSRDFHRYIHEISE